MVLAVRCWYTKSTWHEQQCRINYIKNTVFSRDNSNFNERKIRATRAFILIITGAKAGLWRVMHGLTGLRSRCTSRLVCITSNAFSIGTATWTRKRELFSWINHSQQWNIGDDNYTYCGQINDQLSIRRIFKCNLLIKYHVFWIANRWGSLIVENFLSQITNKWPCQIPSWSLKCGIAR